MSRACAYCWAEVGTSRTSQNRASRERIRGRRPSRRWNDPVSHRRTASTHNAPAPAERRCGGMLLSSGSEGSAVAWRWRADGWGYVGEGAPRGAGGGVGVESHADWSAQHQPEECFCGVFDQVASVVASVGELCLAADAVAQNVGEQALSGLRRIPWGALAAVGGEGSGDPGADLVTPQPAVIAGVGGLVAVRFVEPEQSGDERDGCAVDLPPVTPVVRRYRGGAPESDGVPGQRGMSGNSTTIDCTLVFPNALVAWSGSKSPRSRGLP